MKRLSLLLFSALALGLSGYFYLFFSLEKRVGHIALTELSPKAEDLDSTRPSLPFFELMAPLPLQPGLRYIPQLEYRKGPPKRFLSKISFLLIPENEESPKERIIYFGRRTQDNSTLDQARWLSGQPKLSHAQFTADAIRYAANKTIPPGVEWYCRPLLKLVYLNFLRTVVGRESMQIYITNQSNTPAFLFYPKFREQLGEQANAWFFRRNTLYEYRLQSKREFTAIDPVDIFMHSFLVAKRGDAMSFIASELSNINLHKDTLQKLSLEDLQWPLLLLGAKLSVDPASIHAFFHFAGLNALLYNSFRVESDDLDLIDSFRNNVLVADRYGKDIAPKSRQSSEMSRLSRRLIDML